MNTKLLTAALAVGSLGAAGATGYLMSEMRQAAPVASALAAPVELPPAPVTPVDTAPVAATPPAPRRAPAPPERTERRGEPAPVAAPAPPAAAAPSLPVSTAAPPIVAPVLEPLALPAPPVTTVELRVEADSVVGVRLEHPVSSATAKIEDPVAAIVTRDVVVDGRTAIAAGSRIEGYVSEVERGGKFREKARIGLRFTTLVVSATERLPILTETIHRDGESPTADATARIGASAVAGTVLGAIIGGKKGAAIGGATGAAGGTAVVAAGGTQPAALAGGASLTLRLLDPVVIVVRRDP